MGVLKISEDGITFVEVPNLLAPNAVTAGAVIADNAVVRGDGGVRAVQDSSLTIADNGVLSIPGIGDGGLADYDLKVGDTATPDYGMILFGDGVIGRTSYNVAACDLDGTVIIRQLTAPVGSNIEFAILESGGQAIRFALAKSAVGNATYNPRSMLIAGPAVLDDEIVTVGYWQGQGIFDNLVCDTAGDGADLGVQNDLEVEGDIFVDSIKESTAAAGITFAHKIILSADLQIGGNDIVDSEGDELIKFSPHGGVSNNEITVANAGVGNAPAISATGVDANIDLELASKGTGIVKFTTDFGADDNVKLQFGNGTDFEIYSDGTRGQIDGDVRIGASGDLIGLLGTTPDQAIGHIYFSKVQTVGTPSSVINIALTYQPIATFEPFVAALKFTVINDSTIKTRTISAAVSRKKNGGTTDHAIYLDAKLEDGETFTSTPDLRGATFAPDATTATVTSATITMTGFYVEAAPSGYSGASSFTYRAFYSKAGTCHFNDDGGDYDFVIEGDGNVNCFTLDAGNDNITINAAAVSANYDLMLAGDGVLGLKETTTPTADTNYGKVYCKSDNKLYFQDGAGTEHEVAFV